MIGENPAVFLRDFGVPCSAGGHAFLGIDDQPDLVVELHGVPVRSTDRQLTATAADAAAAGLAPGVAVTVNGQARTVREVLAQDDGRFVHITTST